ncbi:MAG TPA: hypothetical protein VEP90_00130 [Methylomirabilota bacterium]|nr:hypothetical protein [Methylomirabilota bacterium]
MTKITKEQQEQFKQEKVELRKKHLLWWIFEVGQSGMSGPSVWDKGDFDRVNAPDWAWKAFEKKKREWAG